MTGGNLISLGMAIIGVAMLTVAVTHPETADLIKAMASGFQGALGTAMGH